MTRRPARQVPWDKIEADRRERAARAPGAPRDLGSCEGPNCSAKIRWAVTEDGRRMPVDFAPDPAGNLIRVMVAAGDWRIRVLATGEQPEAGTMRWTSHYATCPDAGWFRARGRGRGDGVRPALRGRPAGRPDTPPVLLAVDGPSLAHRAFHAYERSAMRDPDGRPVWAVYGFLALLAGIVDKVRPDAVLVGWDDRVGSARRDRYPDYKAGRAEKSPDLRPQLDDIDAVLAQLDVAQLTVPGLGADDVLASASARAEAAGWRCTVATSDKDSFALVTELTTVLRLVSGLDNAQEITPPALAELYGVRPDQWLDYAALVGDTSDNLSGVAGIGPKTAVRLLATCGTLDAALADPAAAEAAIGKAAAAKLASDQARHAIDRNRDLMAPVRNIDIDPGRCRPDVAAGTVAAVLRARHLPSLVDRVTAALCRHAAPTRSPTRGHLSAVPPPREAPAPESPDPAVPAGAEDQLAPPLAEQDPPPECPDCGRAAAAALPLATVAYDASGAGLALTGDQVLVDRAHPSGDLVAVLVDGVWAVRRIAAGEYYLRQANRRRSHHCIRYDHQCAACGGPARLYPCGPRCGPHAPGAARPPAVPGMPGVATRAETDPGTVARPPVRE